MFKSEKNSPFDSDARRIDLIHGVKLEEFRKSYEIGVMPELADMSTAELWDDLADFDEVPPFRLKRLKTIANIVRPKKTVLDVGIGWGEIIPMLHEKGISSYTGIDFSEKIIERVSLKYPQHNFLVGSIDSIKNQYDEILVLEVCEHILPTKVLQFYQNLKLLLKPGGRLIISVPVNEDLRRNTLKCPNCGSNHSRMGHVRNYSSELIGAELALANFHVIETIYLYSSFNNSMLGLIKRHLVDIGRKLLGFGKAIPVGLIVIAVASS